MKRIIIVLYEICERRPSVIHCEESNANVMGGGRAHSCIVAMKLLLLHFYICNIFPKLTLHLWADFLYRNLPRSHMFLKVARSIFNFIKCWTESSKAF